MKKKNKFDKYLLLNWKKVGWVVLAWFISVVLHNLWYALFNFEEAVFFLIAVIILPLYIIVLIIYSLFNIIKRR